MYIKEPALTSGSEAAKREKGAHENELAPGAKMPIEQRPPPPAWFMRLVEATLSEHGEILKRERATGRKLSETEITQRVEARLRLELLGVDNRELQVA